MKFELPVSVSGKPPGNIQGLESNLFDWTTTKFLFETGYFERQLKAKITTNDSNW